MSFREPESPRDAKGRLKQRMHSGRRYSPPRDQASLTEELDLASTYRGCRSFRKLVSEVGTLLRVAGALTRGMAPRRLAVIRASRKRVEIHRAGVEADSFHRNTGEPGA